MSTVSVDLSIEQLKQALKRLPQREKLVLWRLLDEDIDRATIARKFETSLKGIRKTYEGTSEEEILADAVKATRAVRHAKSRS